jgi:ribosome-associated protein
MRTVVITPGLEVPLSELVLRTSRSGGPGGQHVNTTSSRVELRFDLAASPSLTEPQRTLARRRLASRLTLDGVLVLHADEHRSQHRNRAAVLERFAMLLAESLTPELPRHPTRPTRGSKERRLDSKRARSDTKRLRRSPDD